MDVSQRPQVFLSRYGCLMACRNATRVKKLKTQLRKEGWIQRNLMPDYVCYSVEEDEFFRLSELEEEAYGYEQDVVVCTVFNLFEQ